MTDILLRARKDAVRGRRRPRTRSSRTLIARQRRQPHLLDGRPRILTTAGDARDRRPLRHRPGDADRINERYDAYVIPLANAFRLSYEPTLDPADRSSSGGCASRSSILGVGAQVERAHNDTTRLRPIEPAVRDFVAAVLDRGAVDRRPRRVDARLPAPASGFRDVEVIGCPSMFMDGDRLAIREARPDRWTATPRLAINVSPYVQGDGPDRRGATSSATRT